MTNEINSQIEPNQNPGFLEKGQKTTDPELVMAENRAKLSIISLGFLGVLSICIIIIIGFLIYKGQDVPSEITQLLTGLGGYIAGAMANRKG